MTDGQLRVPIVMGHWEVAMGHWIGVMVWLAGRLSFVSDRLALGFVAWRLDETRLADTGGSAGYHPADPFVGWLERGRLPAGWKE